jgi:hypothetical protein
LICGIFFIFFSVIAIDKREIRLFAKQTANSRITNYAAAKERKADYGDFACMAMCDAMTGDGVIAEGEITLTGIFG